MAFSARQTQRADGDAARVTLSDQRLKLAKAIRTFHTAGKRHVGPNALSVDAEDRTLFGEEWDFAGELSSTQTSAAMDPLQPENHPLALPSTLGLTYLAQHRILHLAGKELLLREGQLNDCLQAIRTGIGFKSMLFRKKVRGASSTRAKLRSFDEVHLADDGIRKHVRIYMQARNAALQLFDRRDSKERVARDAFLSKYKTISNDDLKASTTVLEAFTPGLRNKPEAWFWSVKADNGATDAAWMRDCEYNLNRTMAAYSGHADPSYSQAIDLASCLCTEGAVDGGARTRAI